MACPRSPIRESTIAVTAKMLNNALKDTTQALGKQNECCCKLCQKNLYVFHIPECNARMSIYKSGIQIYNTSAMLLQKCDVKV